MISAAGQLRRCDCPPAIRSQAGDLLLTLAAVECHASLGGLAAAPRALLRDLVIITARLAGPTCLETSAGNTAAFTAVQGSWQLPPLPEPDRVLARVLADRSGLPPADGGSLYRTNVRWRLTPPLWCRAQTGAW
jgi:hypothetical protein